MSDLIPQEEEISIFDSWSHDLWATATVWAEARGESFEGKLAVGEVIRNRMKRKYMSDGTLFGTIFKKLQFSCWNTGELEKISKTAKPGQLWDECFYAWKASEYSNVSRNAVLYLNPAVATDLSWINKVEFLVKIGQHNFYTEKKFLERTV